jgi:hypothetical protein
VVQRRFTLSIILAASIYGYETAASANLTVSAATMASGSVALQALFHARNISQAVDIVAAEPPSDLMIRNRAALDQMAIDRGLRKRFLGQKQYSPRAKTILITALAAMQNTAGRAAMLEVALDATDEVVAILYQQMAEMLNDYDERVAPIVRLTRFNHVVVADLQSGKAVVLMPIDWAIWNERAAAAAAEIAKMRHLRPGGDGFELWITGTASPRFLRGTEALGIRVREGVGKQLPLLD